MKIIFFGSDDFAVKNLENLVATDHKVLACVTQPDKAKGRGLKISPPLVKNCALKHKIPVLQPKDVKDAKFIEQLKKMDSDLFVVIAYGRILPKEVLNIPKLFCINVHASLLPRHRGAAPINWAIINGDEKTGVSVIKMNEIMDAGDIIAEEIVPIKDDDTAMTLRLRMADSSARLLINTIQSIEADNYKLKKQDLSGITYAPKLTKELGIIKWEEPAEHIHNLVRGLNPRPGAYTFFKNKFLKVLETEVCTLESAHIVPGEVVTVAKDGIIVGTSDKVILIKRLHLESSKEMDAKSFAAGHKINVGFRFGRG